MERNNIGLFIDVENISHLNIKCIIDRISKYISKEKETNPNIKITHKLAFADWSKQSTLGWLEAIKEYGIKQKHTTAFSTGKNASDISIVIYAMDAVFNKNIDTFIIATGDSDFTELSFKLKEYGKNVFICGGKETSLSLRNSGDEFWLFDDIKCLKNDNTEILKPLEKRKNKKNRTILDDNILEIAKETFQENISINNGYPKKLDISFIYNKMKIKSSELGFSFDYKTYGFKKLKDLFLNLDIFKLSSENKGRSIIYYVEMK